MRVTRQMEKVEIALCPEIFFGCEQARLQRGISKRSLAALIRKTLKLETGQGGTFCRHFSLTSAGSRLWFPAGISLHVFGTW